MIEIFDVQRPGQASQKIPTIPQKRTKEGQKGMRRSWRGAFIYK